MARRTERIFDTLAGRGNAITAIRKISERLNFGYMSSSACNFFWCCASNTAEYMILSLFMVNLLMIDKTMRVLWFLTLDLYKCQKCFGKSLNILAFFCRR